MESGRRGKPNPESDPSGATSIMERRRTGKIVHDERGNARLEWVNAPAEESRVTLSLEDTQSLRKPEHGYDPYRKAPRTLQRTDQGERPAKRDLRKLSEWIKQMRELEARKQRDDEK
jgi:hypothetical protein